MRQVGNTCCVRQHVGETCDDSDQGYRSKWSGFGRLFASHGLAQPLVAQGAFGQDLVDLASGLVSADCSRVVGWFDRLRRSVLEHWKD